MEQIEEEELTGKTIMKEYIIKKKIDEGTFGKLYVVSYSKTGELFAAKLVINII